MSGGPGIGPLAGFRGRDGDRTGRGASQSRPAQALYREWLVLLGAYSAGSAVLQARQQGVSGLRRAHGLLRPAAAGDVPALPGIPAEVPAVGGRPARADRPRNAPRAHTRNLRPAADLVPAARGSSDRPGGVPLSRDHPAAGGHVPFLGLDECVAAPNPYAQPALCAGSDLRRARSARWRLGLGHLEPRPHQGGGRANGSGEFQHASGPGTRSASAAAPGRSIRSRRKRRKGS